MQSTATYTPGPWRARKVLPEQWLVRTLCADEESKFDGPIVATTRTAGDADLIAAAPELLEILEEILARRPFMPRQKFPSMWGRAALIVTKAKGKQLCE